MPEMLTIQEIANILKISYETALDFVKYSGIDYIRIGRQYRVAKENLSALLSKKGGQVLNLSSPSVIKQPISIYHHNNHRKGD